MCERKYCSLRRSLWRADGCFQEGVQLRKRRPVSESLGGEHTLTQLSPARQWAQS